MYRMHLCVLMILIPFYSGCHNKYDRDKLEKKDNVQIGAQRKTEVVGKKRSCILRELRSYNYNRKPESIIIYSVADNLDYVLDSIEYSKVLTGLNDVVFIDNSLWIGSDDGTISVVSIKKNVSKNVSESSMQCSLLSFDVSSSGVKNILYEEPKILVRTEKGIAYRVELNDSNETLNLFKHSSIHNSNEQPYPSEKETKSRSCQVKSKSKVVRSMLVKDKYCCYLKTADSTCLGCYSIAEVICKEPYSILFAQMNFVDLDKIAISAEDEDWCFVSEAD